MSTQHLCLPADDGELLHLSVSGHGPPLLLLHGWTSSHASWSPLLSPLMARHQLIRPDARGHGGHALQVCQTPDVARLARDVLNLLDHLGLAQVVLVGHSMGALTAWQFLRDHGSRRVAALVVLDQSPKLMTDATWAHGIYGDFDARRSAQFTQALQQDFAEAVLRLAAHGLNARARDSYERDSAPWQRLRVSLRGLAPAPLIAIWQSLVQADFRDVLAQVDRPCLLVYGTASNFYTEATARYVAQHTPGAHLLRYPDADHSPHLLQAQRFVCDLQAFLAAQNLHQISL